MLYFSQKNIFCQVFCQVLFFAIKWYNKLHNHPKPTNRSNNKRRAWYSRVFGVGYVYLRRICMDACRRLKLQALKGKDILMWATIGLVVIFASYAVVKFVIEGIAGKA